MEKKLKPAEGRTVPMEDGRDWPAGGVAIALTHYVRRRLSDGDLVEVAEEPAAPPSEQSNDETSRKGGKTGGK